MRERDKISALMEKSRKRFIEQYPEDFQKLLKEVLSCIRKPETEPTETLHRHFHSLKGAMATLGMADAAVLAEEGELLLEEQGVSLWAHGDALRQLLHITATLEAPEDFYKASVQERFEESHPSEEGDRDPQEDESAEEDNASLTSEDQESKLPKSLTRYAKPARILVVDDDVQMLSILEDILRAHNYEVLITANPIDALDLLETERVDLALVDVLMPKKSGFDIHQYINDKNLDIPVILLTGLRQESIKIKALLHGVEHLIRKPFKTEELLASIEGVLSRHNIKRQNVVKDELTGALTRKYFTERFEEELSRHRQTGGVLSVAFVDLDGFKGVNDKYDHLVGDDLLREFYKVMRSHIDLNHEIYRYGGDEFVMLLPWTGGDEAAAVLEDFRKKLENHIFTLEGQEKSLRLTISAGIAEVKDFDMPLTEILKVADEALYHAKEKGRNRVVFEYDKRPVESKRILVVDDFPFIVRLIKTRLSYLGYKLDHASDGEEALKKIRIFEPDLVLLDIMLPKINGMEVLKTLEEDDTITKKPKVIVVSSKSKEKDIVASLQLGAKDFITKPFSLEVMEEKIKKYI